MAYWGGGTVAPQTNKQTNFTDIHQNIQLHDNGFSTKTTTHIL